MEMRTVYRYENAYGQGPYGSSWDDTVAEWAMITAHNNSTHPAWGSKDGFFALVSSGPDLFEGVELPSEEWLCGCESLESLHSWFDGYEESLAENGFSIEEYEVPAYQVMDSPSGRQIAFYV